jgi:hypothetical protein
VRRLSDKMCRDMGVTCVLFVLTEFFVFTIENGDVRVIDCAKWLVSSDNLVP